MALAGASSALKEEANSADEGSRDIQVLEAEQKPMMSLSCQYLVTRNSQTLQVCWNQAAWWWSELGGRWELSMFSGSVHL